MRLARSGVGVGDLAGARVGRAYNALCGDECVIYARLGGGGDIAALAHRTRGCVLCCAAAARLSEIVGDGAAVAAVEVLARDFETALAGGGEMPALLGMFAPVAGRKSRHGCVLLPFEALRRAVVRSVGGGC